MNRRDFLKLGSTVSALLYLPVGTLARSVDSLTMVEMKGVTYRGTHDGKVYSSVDGGKSWNLLVDFGREIAILSLDLLPGSRLYARLGFAGRDFHLVYTLKDNAWRTA